MLHSAMSAVSSEYRRPHILCLPAALGSELCRVIENIGHPYNAVAPENTGYSCRDTVAEMIGPPCRALVRRPCQVHLGVNSAAESFALEQRAYNEADFRCRDEAGWQPSVSE